LNFLQGFHGLIETAESASVVSLNSGDRNPFNSKDYLEYFGEFKAIFETILALNQGPRGVSLIQKTQGIWQVANAKYYRGGRERSRSCLCAKIFLKVHQESYEVRARSQNAGFRNINLRGRY
jgi:hypothetical protein